MKFKDEQETRRIVREEIAGMLRTLMHETQFVYDDPITRDRLMFLLFQVLEAYEVKTDA